MISITGKTFEWKSELKKAGFAWDAGSKSWTRENELDPNGSWAEHVQIIRGVESGDLQVNAVAKADPNALPDGNARAHWELYGQYAK